MHGILWAIPGLGHLLASLWALVSALVQVGFLIVLIIAIVKAFSGVRWDIPWVGPMARKQTNETAVDAAALGRSGNLALTRSYLRRLRALERRSHLQRTLQEQLHHHLVQDQFVIKLAGDDLHVCRQAGSSPAMGCSVSKRCACMAAKPGAKH